MTRTEDYIKANRFLSDLFRSLGIVPELKRGVFLEYEEKLANLLEVKDGKD